MKNINYFTLTVIYLSLFTSVRSQTIIKKEAAIKFQSGLQSGSLFGQSGSKPALTISTINGVKIKQWFTGVGVGIDYYGAKRSIPLFAAVQKSISPKVNSFFLYGNAGYNLPWLQDQEKMKNVVDYKQTGGLFYDAGIGYQFKISKFNKLGLSVGYSFKEVTEKYNYQYIYYCLTCQSDIGIPPLQTNNYKFRTVAVKINWWFL